MTPKWYLVLGVLALGLVFAGCNPDPTIQMRKGQALLDGRQYGPAINEFDKVLAAQPDNKGALLGKARSLYMLKKYQEALALFEKFIADTESERALYRNDRFDAEFYRDKCKQALGETVEQNPLHIPPPPMGE